MITIPTWVGVVWIVVVLGYAVLIFWMITTYRKRLHEIILSNMEARHNRDEMWMAQREGWIKLGMTMQKNNDLLKLDKEGTPMIQ